MQKISNGTPAAGTVKTNFKGTFESIISAMQPDNKRHNQKLTKHFERETKKGESIFLLL